MFDEKFYITKILSVICAPPAQPFDKKRVSYGPRTAAPHIVLNLAGETYTSFDKKVLHMLPGMVEFLPKRENIEYYVDRISLGDCLMITFETTAPLSEEAFSVDTRENKKIRPLFEKIYQLWLEKKDGYYQRCVAIFYEILAEISLEHNKYITKDKYAKIEKGVSYLHDHSFDKEIDYYEPSRLCDMSYTYFKKLFLLKFNIAPVQYVTQLRLERSIELLSSGCFSVTEIAEMCGFESVYYFSRVFKKAYGVSPINYKLS